MMLHLLSFAVAVLAVVHALPQSTLHAILQRNGPLWASAAHFEGLASSPSSSFVGAGASPTPVPESWFEGQNVDHFNGGDTRTWRQRYFARLDFWKGEGPVFVCVGGEGPPLDGTVLTASVHCNDMVELAPTVGRCVCVCVPSFLFVNQHSPMPVLHVHSATGALMFAVEHRYYGTSLPTPDFSTANMVYLSSDQAVPLTLVSYHNRIRLSCLFSGLSGG